MNVLVTGGAGLIGTHLCEKLLDEGHRVFCVDNFSSGQKANIVVLSNNSQFTLIEHDICIPLTVDEKIDQIYNLASPASPLDFTTLSLEILHANSLGLENMLNLAKEHSARIVHASTSEVYGDPLEHPQKETYFGNVNSYGPRSCYDESKRYGEALIYSYRKRYTLDTGIVRIFNTYGPYMRPDDGRVISTFVVQALKGDDLTVMGTGDQTRSFCFVSDMVSGLQSMMESTEEGPINLGNPDEYAIVDFAEKVIAFTGTESKINYIPLTKDDPEKRRPDISLAKEKLGFNPQVALKEGISKTVDYFKGII
ncbi:SDR family oxidoreductase [Patescibacteria group bacterium]|nr:SDR family oxidoreductase [Patescibacteria group bacterium]